MVHVPGEHSPAPDPPPVDTHCPYCSLQCGMTLRPTPRDRGSGGTPGRVEVMERTAFPVNRGAL
ncbi:hypothetical protein, partial [Streptomyces antimycoticus]|uniref:hypothetical protein n=1 Tax=Streptomyces antimycoticus TaxID=68175 RepID=UPI00117C6B13